MSIPPALDHPANAGALRYLGREWTASDLPPVRPPAAVSDPYYALGTHPDIVERLWAGLNKSLPEDCRWVVYRTPALVHPRSGAILAFGIGTGYALWAPPPALQAALQAGAEQAQTYMGGRVLDLRDFGPGWVFGRWYRGEEEWCMSAYQAAEPRVG